MDIRSGNRYSWSSYSCSVKGMRFAIASMLCFSSAISIIGISIPEQVTAQAQDSTAPQTQQPDWILLYPQHPLYRQKLQERSNSPTVTNSGGNSQTTVQSSPSQSVLPQSGDRSNQTQRDRPQPPVNPANLSQLPQPSNPPLFIDPIPAPTVKEPEGVRYFPGFSAGSPSAFGANSGDVFAGASYINRSESLPTNPNSKADASISLGFGLGDSEKLVGLETVFNIFSTTPSRFAENGGFDFKLHRYLGDLTAIAVGWENPIKYGPDTAGTVSSVYGVLSKLFVLQPENPQNPMILSLSAGVGGGRFRSYGNQLAGNGSVGVFGNIGLQVLSNVSLIADWTGQTLNLGVSYVPFRNIPFTLTGIAVDVAGSTPFQTRYALSAGFGFNFR